MLIYIVHPNAYQRKVGFPNKVETTILLHLNLNNTFCLGEG
jgi:hypothetical protein